MEQDPETEASQDVMDESESEVQEYVQDDSVQGDNKPGLKPFAEAGLSPELVRTCAALGWKTMTPIQEGAIPMALKGKDIIGLAVTGSGKTAAFVLPILDSMIRSGKMSPFYALVIAPVRELCVQIAEQFRALGSLLRVRVVTLFGGVSVVEEQRSLASKPEIVVGCPGRILHHLESTRGFDVSEIRFLVLDEADRILSMDFETELTSIVKRCGKDRQTFLYSATMSTKVNKLKLVYMRDPVKVFINQKYSTAANLEQFMLLVPPQEKFVTTFLMIKSMSHLRGIIFCNTCKIAHVLCIFLNRLKVNAVPLTGDMLQNFRIHSINQFKNKNSNYLVTTEVGSRGLDLPTTNFVINYDVPLSFKQYIHRIGRTARAGQSGKAFTFVNQYDVQVLVEIENEIKMKLEKLPTPSLPKSLMQINFSDHKLEAEREYENLRGKKSIFKKPKKAKKSS